MITYKSQKQPTLEGFETPFEVKLDATFLVMNLMVLLRLFIKAAPEFMIKSSKTLS